MRLFFVLGLFLFQPLSAWAAVTPEALREMAYAGDIDGAEAAFAQAHAESLEGTISYNDLRELVTILIASHPDVIDFVDAWMAEYPDSPYAQTAYAFQMRATAWRLRGESYAGRTPPEAMQAFRDLQNQGMTIALEAYARVPDYVPASDAVILHQLTTKRLDWDAFEIIVADVMAITPNRGSLWRASLLTLPQWGGVGHRGVQGLCEHYADQIPDVEDGYTVDVCIVDLIHTTSSGEAAQAFANRRLGTLTHPNVLLARLRQARDRGNPEDDALILSYLADVGLNDRFNATNLAWQLRITDEAEAQLRAMDARWQAEAEAGIIHDPYSKDYIDVLLGRYNLPIALGRHFDAAKRAQRDLLEQRLAASAIFDAGAWADVGLAKRGSARSSADMLLADPYYINAMHYGNYAQEYTTGLLAVKSDLFAVHQMLIESGQPTELTNTQIEHDVLCPLARVDRLFVEKCETNPDPHHPCSSFEEVYPSYRVAMDYIVAEGMCEAERNAPIEDLLYEPVRPAFDELHLGIANR
ncbi:DUF4034 domain-containing protein [Yoonia sp. I 8.24]|uniref:DUF4034 domain-containing protein n=1 Tax=Yoonia sp. I 8.24 TaxID=1537229 RepID=UPI001EE13F7A|nr:DUF4034 domain-containing protein [Yoonia sp. I 8.24]MCG3267795.1 DUF4034 domain-containing protein [Yoonia sp. I 8.24]